MPVKTNSAVPVRKVAAGGVGGALSTIIIFVLNHYLLKSDPLDGTISAAITTLVTFAVSYIVPPSATESNVPA
jgi:H+/Cl- antiporter ClcA